MFYNNVSSNILLNIFQYSTIKDILSFYLSFRKIYHLITDKEWKKIYISRYEFIHSPNNYFKYKCILSNTPLKFNNINKQLSFQHKIYHKMISSDGIYIYSIKNNTIYIEDVFNNYYKINDIYDNGNNIIGNHLDFSYQKNNIIISNKYNKLTNFYHTQKIIPSFLDTVSYFTIHKFRYPYIILISKPTDTWVLYHDIFTVWNIENNTCALPLNIVNSFYYNDYEISDISEKYTQWLPYNHIYIHKMEIYFMYNRIIYTLSLNTFKISRFLKFKVERVNHMCKYIFNKQDSIFKNSFITCIKGICVNISKKALAIHIKNMWYIFSIPNLEIIHKINIDSGDISYEHSLDISNEYIISSGKKCSTFKINYFNLKLLN